jgi:hypothetical protein
MSAIDWSILKPVDIGGAAMQGYRQGRSQSAMGALARDPTNRDALAALYDSNPDAAIRMETVGRERSKWQQDQTALAAQRAYITSRYGGGVAPIPDALAHPGSGTPIGRPPTPGPTPAPSPAVGTLDALAPIGGDIRIAPSGVQNALAPAGSMPATSARMNAPGPMSPGADPAWLAYAQADPKGAMEARKTETEWQSERLKLNKAGLEEHQAVNSAAIQLLNGVTDQASYDRARADSARLYDQYGYEHPELPDEYHPELVNALRHRALEIKDDIAADLNERKQQWQQQDDRIDNARDDRRVAITDRSARSTDARGWRADRRAQVRFGERALDRAAMAGVRSDISDLDY